MKPLELIRNSNCDLCQLSEGVKNICIMGTGKANAKLMFIGESPGEEEDRKGEPFIGKSGKMYDAILKHHKIDRADVYTTNILKCRPPFGSKPNTNIISICSSNYLRQEIEIVKPELIVCLGGIAAKCLLNDNNIQVTSVRKSVYYTTGPMPKGIPFIVTYHPAAVISQDHLLKFIVEDIEWAKELLNGKLPKKKKKLNYQKINTLLDIPSTTSNWVNLDLETDGLDPFLPNKEILSVQLSHTKGIAYYLDWNNAVGNELKTLLQFGALNVNGHNIKFDLKWLRMKADIIHTGQVNDTYQNINLLDENFPNKSLDVVATSFTDLKGHKTEFVKLINQYVKMHKEKKEPITLARQRLWSAAFYAIPEAIRIKYGCGDVDAVHRLQRIFMPKIEEQGMLALHTLMMDTTKMFVDIECNGMKIDEPLVEELSIKYAKRIKKLKKKLDALAPIELNHNAPLQLRNLLYGTWKCKPHEIRMGKKKVKYSTGKAALDLILEDNIPNEVREYITFLNEFKKLSKLRGTYLVGMPRFLRDGYIHATWNMAGADTGRSSCSNPNLQQIPRSGDIKALFISRF